MKKALLDGKRVKREGWYGDHHLEIITPEYIQRIQGADPENNPFINEPFVLIQTQRGKRGPWLCSPEDFFAEDWVLVD